MIYTTIIFYDLIVKYYIIMIAFFLGYELQGACNSRLYIRVDINYDRKWLKKP